MPFPGKGSHHNRTLVGDELEEFKLAYRLAKHAREGNTRQVDRVLAEGASIDGSYLMEERPLMIASGNYHPKVSFRLAHGGVEPPENVGAV